MVCTREILIKHQYLNFPVKNDAPKHKVQLIIDNQVVRFFDIEYSDGEPDYWVFMDVTAFCGKKLIIQFDNKDKKPVSSDSFKYLDEIVHTDSIIDDENLYHEKYRPQYHFTSRRGWINDPNGLVFYNGTYHMFYQHNPFGRKWGNMHWGYAASKNLVEWEEFSDVFYPDEMGTMFSGCAIVDWENTASLKTGSNDTLICFYTAAGEYVEPKMPFTQCLAYSNDAGQTWKKFEGNPILDQIDNMTRDPCVLWDPGSKQWIMALYIGYDKQMEHNNQHYALFVSTDLIVWKPIQDIFIPGRGECPDFFPMHLDGNKHVTKWVFWTADGHYVVGTFDGESFIPETKVLKSTSGPDDDFRCSYAAQTWSDIPPRDGRRIQIAWLINDIPDMSFNQQMTFPLQLTLKTTKDGPQLCFWPVEEIELLYQEERKLNNVQISDKITFLPTQGHDLLDIQLMMDAGDADELELNLRGIPITIDVNKQEIVCLKRRTKLKFNKRINLRVLLDRTSIEIFAENGLVYIPFGITPEEINTTCTLQSRGGNGLAKNIYINFLRSAWKRHKN